MEKALMRAWVTCMIYRSAMYADSVVESLEDTTPELFPEGGVRFSFVANDPEPGLVDYLRANEWPVIVHQNPKHTEAELFAKGIGWPEYMHRVYRCMNWTIEAAPCDTLVFVSSDNVFTPGWLGKLLDRWTPDMALIPLTVEPGPIVFGPELTGLGAVRRECGRSPEDFDNEAFQNYARELATDEMTPGGVFLPLVISRAKAIEAGLYPEGNIAGSSFHDVRDYGDRVFFRRLAAIGVKHMTYRGSVVYHFNQGEKRTE